MPAYLCDKAAYIGVNFEKLVRSILTPHAFLNLRRAQGIISLANNYPAELIEQAAGAALTNFRSITPKLFKALIENIQQRHIENNSQLSLSDETCSFVRDMEYFLYNQ